MKASFRSLIRDGKLKGPNEKGFSIDKWQKAWDISATEEEKHIYEAGLIFNDTLTEIRIKLDRIYKDNFPGTNLRRLVETYVSISNRDISILLSFAKGIEKNKNIFGLSFSNNPMGNSLSIEEISTGSVDGLKNAICSCLNSISKNKKPPAGACAIHPIDFLKTESYLSMLYTAHAEYWQAIVWGDYSFKKEAGYFLVKQEPTEQELAFEVSNLRKARFLAARAAISTSNSILDMLRGRYKYIALSDSQEKLKVLPVDTAESTLQAANAERITSIIDVLESFPKEIVRQEIPELGFSIIEALEVLRPLSLLAIQLLSRMNNCDTNIHSLAGISKYSGEIDRKQLIRAIAGSTGHSHSKSRKILDFITFSGDQKQDIWAHPIIQAKPGKLLAIIGALAHPIYLRTAERWLYEVLGNDQILKKGDAYEHHTLEVINSALNKNKTITDYSPARPAKISIAGVSEQIDLVFRLGNVVVVGEIKSIFTSDNPASHYRTRERLKVAANQVKRKAEFIEKNLEEAFKSLKWGLCNNKEYTVIPLIVNSNKTHSGFPVDEVPVSDEKILESYLSKNTFPLVSYFDQEKKEHITIAEYRLYDDFDQLQKNLFTYLSSPPVVEGESLNFQSKETILPCISESSHRIAFSRLTYREDSDCKRKLETSRSFPIEKSLEYESITNEMGVIF